MKSNFKKESIWHIGRFVIKRGVGNINLFKKLMVCAIAPICNDKTSIAFAECDSKLLRVILSLGIVAIPVDKAITYLGSETFPIMMNYNGLIDFYRNNKWLLNTNL